MSEILTPSSIRGKPILEGFSGFRTHDTASDAFSGGAFLHNPLELSATELDEITSREKFLQEILRQGTAALDCRNQTGGNLVAGDLVYISSWDSGTSRFLVAKSAATAVSTLPQFVVVDATVSDNTNFCAYARYQVTGLNTNAYAADTILYASDTAGAWSNSAGTVNREVGRVLTQDLTAGVVLFYPGGTQPVGISGFSGFSGQSGTSGTSGYSGMSGAFSGKSGFSGYSGYSGASGTSGYSGYSGYSGTSGYSGFSGTFSGYSGVSGYSGYSGGSGPSGTSGFSGTFSGYSGQSGYSGTSGYSGFSGFSSVGLDTNFVITSGDTTRSTGIAVDADFDITLASGKTYVVTLNAHAESASYSGMDIKLQFTGTTSTTIRWTTFFGEDNTYSAITRPISMIDNTTVTGNLLAAVKMPIHATTIFTTTSTGTVRFHWGKASGGNITVYAGSALYAQEITT